MPDIFITCALTGAGDTAGRSDKVPVSPAQIASAAIAAAKAGAAVAHIHVRDPRTGKPARDPELYRETVARVRESGTDVVLNLTAGMGGDLVLGPGENPLPPAAGTDLAGPSERLFHIRELRPEICTLDCGSMNFAAGGDYVMVNPPRVLADMAAQIRALGVKPELEIFDTGDLTLANEMVNNGVVASPAVDAVVHGHPLRNARRPRHFFRRRRAASGGRRLVVVRHRANANAVDGRLGLRRRQRPRRLGGQLVFEKRRPRRQRATR